MQSYNPEEKKNMRNDLRRGILCLSLVISATVFSTHGFETSSFSGHQNNVFAVCNGTRAENCILNVNGDQNRLTKRLLQGVSVAPYDRHICYKAIQKPWVCNGNIYGNCIGPIRGSSYRPCTVYTRCKRGSW